MTITILAITVLLFNSCEKKEGAAQTAVSAPIPDSSVVTVPVITSTPGYVLRVNAAFYSLEADTGSESDKTKWEASMTLGEKVSVIDKRRATFSGDGVIYDFVEIRRDDGKEGLAWAEQIAAGSSLAVVIDEKANLYKTAKAVDVTGQILSRKTIVGLFPETESNGFVEIKAYDPVSRAYRQNFIRVISISRKDADIQSAILLQTAEPLKNEGSEKIRKEALLETALLDYPDSVFNAEIIELIVPNTSVVIGTEPAGRMYMLVNDNNVNVRDLPDPIAGRVIGQLNSGEDVTISEQTVNTSTIDGRNARWYRITRPLEGWVFGAFLD